MKILITGADGLVATRVIKLLPQKFHLLTPDLDHFNLLNQSQTATYIKDHQPDIVIHFAAYTNVSEAEKQFGDQQAPCWRTNVQGTRNLIKSLTATSQQPTAKLIHISTDMVFSGSEDNPGPYPENHPLPISNSHFPSLLRNFETKNWQLSWYGYTKLQAEKLALQAGATIIRLIYPICAHPIRPDYLHKLYQTSLKYPIFNDQQISLTYIDQLTPALKKIIVLKYQNTDNRQPTTDNCIFHISTPDTFTPYQLLKYTLHKLGQDASYIKTASLKDYLKTQQNPYRYPLHGGLQSTPTSKTLNLKFLTWRQVINQLISQGLQLK